MCDMTMESSCYCRGSKFNIRLSREKLESLFIQDLIYCIVPIFCMLIVAEVSNVAHEHLVQLTSKLLVCVFNVGISQYFISNQNNNAWYKSLNLFENNTNIIILLWRTGSMHMFFRDAFLKYYYFISCACVPRPAIAIINL